MGSDLFYFYLILLFYSFSKTAFFASVRFSGDFYFFAWGGIVAGGTDSLRFVFLASKVCLAVGSSYLWAFALLARLVRALTFAMILSSKSFFEKGFYLSLTVLFSWSLESRSGDTSEPRTPTFVFREMGSKSLMRFLAVGLRQ